MTWINFSSHSPELADFAQARLHGKPTERYILFELEVENATVTEYPEGGAFRRHWKAGEQA